MICSNTYSQLYEHPAWIWQGESGYSVGGEAVHPYESCSVADEAEKEIDFPGIKSSGLQLTSGLAST